MIISIKKIQGVFIIYWVLLAYIIAALVWWFIALDTQNKQMSVYRSDILQKDDFFYREKHAAIVKAGKLKTAQYIGEGATFLLLIIAGAIFIFRSVRRELRAGIEQQNFMMAITHELKTPIAVAKLNLETLQKWKLDEAQQRRLLSITLEETNRLDALCNNLLLSSQMEAGGYSITKDETNLSLLTEECADRFKVRCPHRTLIKNIAPDIIVNGDVFLLQIAINNLIENANKYSPKEKPVEVSLQKENDKAFLRVKDEGAGIPEDEKKMIFDKFYRAGNEATKRAKGTGLGLYLTRDIAKTHKGEVSAEDNPAGGSIFVLSLKAEA